MKYRDEDKPLSERELQQIVSTLNNHYKPTVLGGRRLVATIRQLQQQKEDEC